jgi:hypothetical protein
MSNKGGGQSKVPVTQASSWASFLKSIASFNGDLSSLTAPPFILSSTSLVEFSAYWAEYPALLIAPSNETDPAKRALLVLKWFLSTLHQQYCSRNEKFGSEKKPLNPFLGELFFGKWEDTGDIGETRLISEQVSHHPPVTAYAIINDQYGVELQGYNAQKASFSSTIQVKQLGHALLSFYPPGANRDDPSQKETYLITLPSLHIEGLIYGTPFVELEKSVRIASSTGYIAKIDFSGRGWLSGKKNTFTAALYKDGEEGALYTAEGQWSNAFVLRDGRTKKEIETFTVLNQNPTALVVAPIEEQDPWESRRAWYDVATAIERSDMDATSMAKSRIENAQRELRKREKEERIEWERRFFERVNEEEDQVFMRLATMLNLTKGGGIEGDRTGGVWRFAVERTNDAMSPYHKVGKEGLGVES